MEVLGVQKIRIKTNYFRMEGLKQLVEQLIQKNLPLTITTGIVKEVTDDVCLVEREGFPDLIDVRLNAIQTAIEQYFRITPKVGSVVHCALIENQKTEAFLVEYSEIEKIEIVFGTDIQVVFDNQKVMFNEGMNGGMVIIPELVTQLGKLSARVDTVVDAISNSAAVPQDGGAGYKAAMVAAISANTNVEDFSGIEDDKIVH